MLFLGMLSIFLLTASAEYCYNDIEGACSSRPSTTEGDLTPNCNAKFGAIDALQADLQAYANANIESSFEFLLMSTHFANYEANREGFKGLYRKLSDKLWEDGIDLMKYIAQRGGKMNFNQLPRFKKSVKDNNRVLELNELNSLAKALDIQKQLAEEANRIYAQAQHHTKTDADVAHYIKDCLRALSKRVRELSGHTNDLKKLMGERDASVSMFLFDEYLKKTL